MRRLVALGACAVVGLGGCGGDTDSESASTAAGGAEAATSVPERSSKSAAGQGQSKAKEKESSGVKGAEKDSGSSSESASMVKVPPISSVPTEGSESPAPGVTMVKGADNSVQTYGTEASDSARTEAAIALQAYLNARLRADWDAVCAALAQRARAQIEEFEKQIESQSKDVGCAGVMALLDEGTAPSQLRQETKIAEVLSFRGGGHVPGDPSYLIFKGPPESTLYSMPMYLEQGAWKVGLALPAPLPL